MKPIKYLFLLLILLSYLNVNSTSIISEFSFKNTIWVQQPGQRINVIGYFEYSGSLNEVNLTLTYEAYGWVVSYYRLGERFRSANGSCQSALKQLNQRHPFYINYNLKYYAETPIGTVFFNL